MLLSFGFSYEGQGWFYRVAAVVAVVAGAVALSRCRRLRASEAHPLRGWTRTTVARDPGGGVRPVRSAEDDDPATGVRATG